MSARNYVPITAAQARKRYEAGQPIAAAGDRAWFTDEYAPDTVTTWFTAASLGLPFDQILPSRGGSFARPVETSTLDQRRELARVIAAQAGAVARGDVTSELGAVTLLASNAATLIAWTRAAVEADQW